jgi:UDP:flavonoid glycosyltransferase YjiC (YdhE family)
MFQGGGNIPLIMPVVAELLRVVAREAGVRLSCDASAEQIRAAIAHALARPRFKAGAQRFAAVLAREDGARTAAAELVSLATPAKVS